MSPLPDPPHQPVSNTLSVENLSESEREIEASGLDEGSPTSCLASPRIHGPVVPDTGEATTSHPRTNDVWLLAGIFIMLLWPWIFLAVIWARHGVQMDDHVAKVVKKYPQWTSFFITLLGNIVNIIVGIMFSTAVVRFSQEWATNNDHVTVFDVSLISSFRNQNWPWGIKDHKYLLARNRWLPVVLAGVCIAAFALVPAGTTSLITPVSFDRTWRLSGTELDFSSNTTDCVGWFAAYLAPEVCWQDDCFSIDQLVNFLQSGRSNIQSSFANNSESVFLGHAHANSSFRFSGPTRGIVPIGPNGIPGIGALQPSPLSDVATNAAVLSYNYTFEHQGLSSNISCIHDPQSPIRSWPVPDDIFLMAANGSCNDIGLAEVLNIKYYQLLSTQYTLLFWACKSIPTREQDPAYYIYLRAVPQFDNITCTISPIQPAVFPVTYQSGTGVFSTQKQITTSTPANAFSSIIESTIQIIGTVVHEAQTATVNLVSAIVMNGVQGSSDLPSYEALIQGILMDQVTYQRFLYATGPFTPPPASCNRTVNGMLSIEVTGWVGKPVHIGFLMPMTILNLASLIMVLISVRAKRGCYEFDVTDPRSLVLAESTLDESEPSGWADDVSYRSRELAIFQRSTKNASE